MWGKWSKGLVSYCLKTGVVSQVYVAEGVNGRLETKMVGQGVGGGEGSAEKWRGERVGALGRV